MNIALRIYFGFVAFLDVFIMGHSAWVEIRNKKRAASEYILFNIFMIGNIIANLMLVAWR